MAIRAKAGDVLEVASNIGKIYLHYLGKHREYGDTIVVCRTPKTEPVPITADLFCDGYVTFYPVGAAVARGLAQVVGHLPPSAVPERLRRPGVRIGRKVRTWIISDTSGETVKEYLSKEELDIPIAAIWNHEFLIQRVAEAWSPEREGAQDE